MTQTVLLTGATGFVGRQIFKGLLSNNYDVIPVIRHESLSKLDSPEKCYRIHTTENLFSESLENLSVFCNDVDVVIHAAWYAEPGKYLESSKNLDCLQGSLQLARACKNSGVSKFIGIGTCFEYDFVDQLLTVDSLLNPQSKYAISKASLFLLLEIYFRQHSISFSWCRLFYLFGENEDDRRLHTYIKNQLRDGNKVLLGPGDKKRDYLDVKEAANLIINVMQKNKAGPLNICSGKGTTIKEIAEGLAAEFGNHDLISYSNEDLKTSHPDSVVGLPSV